MAAQEVPASLPPAKPPLSVPVPMLPSQSLPSALPQRSDAPPLRRKARSDSWHEAGPDSSAHPAPPKRSHAAPAQPIRLERPRSAGHRAHRRRLTSRGLEINLPDPPGGFAAIEVTKPTGGARPTAAPGAAASGSAPTSRAELQPIAQNVAQMIRASPAAVDSAEAALREGAALLDTLPKLAAACGSTLGAAWQELLAGAPGGSVSGVAMPRTPPRPAAASRLSASTGVEGFDGKARGVQASTSQRWRALVAFEGSEAALRTHCASAAALRGLLRLSLCDDADLALARTVVGDCRDFFVRLRRYATEEGIAPADAWARLLRS